MIHPMTSAAAPLAETARARVSVSSRSMFRTRLAHGPTLPGQSVFGFGNAARLEPFPSSPLSLGAPDAGGTRRMPPTP